uniref:hypothetical protein n=1 Tax=Staphylococcus epidermidis TaxID=1282 RepID=UPI00164335FF
NGEEISNGLNNIKEGEDNVDGGEKLEEEKNRSNEGMGKLNDVNEGEKDGVIEGINGGRCREEVGEKVKEGEGVDEGMKEVEEE